MDRVTGESPNRSVKLLRGTPSSPFFVPLLGSKGPLKCVATQSDALSSNWRLCSPSGRPCFTDSNRGCVIAFDSSLVQKDRGFLTGAGGMDSMLDSYSMTTVFKTFLSYDYMNGTGANQSEYHWLVDIIPHYMTSDPIPEALWVSGGFWTSVKFRDAL